MKTRSKSSLIGIAFSIIASLALNAAPMTNADVVKMVQAGIDETVIVTSIQNAENGFDTSADGLIALSQANVPKPVINAIIMRVSSASTAATTAVPMLAATTAPTPAQAASASVAPVGKGLFIAYEPALSDNEIYGIIRTSADERGWKVASDAPGSMRLEYKGFIIVVSYGGGTILIDHTKKSESWAKNLQSHIQKKLTRTQRTQKRATR